ncbi:PorP/SprF family type IX secretion system membrane protein [Ohtaekwangia koreensis]|uniref:Type IX secretion system membrane protein, PorP/SprF family n=1 Tax=Ohtaekwangia koreensis TaxID=688867 RepID=A0A1T5M3B8_9BACT|nr:PorP/SprF family type IX secretion system membrane protein [Ohtaekwangia koreensis]SKC82514.1 type IX secretion system membrane protein, PorP/SprF family [Ohtaekwangia koreensis]
MSRFFTIIFIFLPVAQVLCQYIPNSGQAFQFATAYNAAFAGVDEFTDIRLGYRYQMAGYGTNAPKFINVVANVRLKQPADVVTNSLRPSKGKGLLSTVPAGKRIIHGLGINVFNEKVGLIERLGGGVSYAFHYPISKTFRLSAGVTAFLENTSLDVNGIYLGENPDQDPFYDHLMQGSSKHSEFSIRGGMLLYSKNFYLGLSYFPIYTKVVTNSDVDFSDPFYQGAIQTGFILPLNSDLTLKPSVLAIVQTDHRVLLDYSIKGYLKNKVWFGLTYRDIKAAVVLAGFDFTKTLTVGYSYEMAMGGFSKFNDGSHDLVLSLRLNNFKGQRSYTW